MKLLVLILVFYFTEVVSADSPVMYHAMESGGGGENRETESEKEINFPFWAIPLENICYRFYDNESSNLEEFLKGKMWEKEISSLNSSPEVELLKELLKKYTQSTNNPYQRKEVDPEEKLFHEMIYKLRIKLILGELFENDDLLKEVKNLKEKLTHKIHKHILGSLVHLIETGEVSNEEKLIDSLRRLPNTTNQEGLLEVLCPLFPQHREIFDHDNRLKAGELFAAIQVAKKIRDGGEFKESKLVQWLKKTDPREMSMIRLQGLISSSMVKSERFRSWVKGVGANDLKAPLFYSNAAGVMRTMLGEKINLHLPSDGKVFKELKGVVLSEPGEENKLKLSLFIPKLPGCDVVSDISKEYSGFQKLERISEVNELGGLVTSFTRANEVTTFSVALRCISLESPYRDFGFQCSIMPDHRMSCQPEPKVIIQPAYLDDEGIKYLSKAYPDVLEDVVTQIGKNQILITNKEREFTRAALGRLDNYFTPNSNLFSQYQELAERFEWLSLHSNFIDFLEENKRDASYDAFLAFSSSLGKKNRMGDRAKNLSSRFLLNFIRNPVIRNHLAKPIETKTGLVEALAYEDFGLVTSLFSAEVNFQNHKLPTWYQKLDEALFEAYLINNQYPQLHALISPESKKRFQTLLLEGIEKSSDVTFKEHLYLLDRLNRLSDADQDKLVNSLISRKDLIFGSSLYELLSWEREKPTEFLLKGLHDFRDDGTHIYDSLKKIANQLPNPKIFIPEIEMLLMNSSRIPKSSDYKDSINYKALSTLQRYALQGEPGVAKWLVSYLLESCKKGVVKSEELGYLSHPFPHAETEVSPWLLKELAADVRLGACFEKERELFYPQLGKEGVPFVLEKFFNDRMEFSLALFEKYPKETAKELQNIVTKIGDDRLGFSIIEVSRLIGVLGKEASLPIVRKYVSNRVPSPEDYDVYNLALPLSIAALILEDSATKEVALKNIRQFLKNPRAPSAKITQEVSKGGTLDPWLSTLKPLSKLSPKDKRRVMEIYLEEMLILKESNQVVLNQYSSVFFEIFGVDGFKALTALSSKVPSSKMRIFLNDYNLSMDQNLRSLIKVYALSAIKTLETTDLKQGQFYPDIAPELEGWYRILNTINEHEFNESASLK